MSTRGFSWLLTLGGRKDPCTESRRAGSFAHELSAPRELGFTSAEPQAPGPSHEQEAQGHGEPHLELAEHSGAGLLPQVAAQLGDVQFGLSSRRPKFTSMAVYFRPCGWASQCRLAASFMSCPDPVHSCFLPLDRRQVLGY